MSPLKLLSMSITQKCKSITESHRKKSHTVNFSIAKTFCTVFWSVSYLHVWPVSFCRTFKSQIWQRGLLASSNVNLEYIPRFCRHNPNHTFSLGWHILKEKNITNSPISLASPYQTQFCLDIVVPIINNLTNEIIFANIMSVM